LGPLTRKKIHARLATVLLGRRNAGKSGFAGEATEVRRHGANKFESSSEFYYNFDVHKVSQVIIDIFLKSQKSKPDINRDTS